MKDAACYSQGTPVQGCSLYNFTAAGMAMQKLFLHSPSLFCQTPSHRTASYSPFFSICINTFRFFFPSHFRTFHTLLMMCQNFYEKCKKCEKYAKKMRKSVKMHSQKIYYESRFKYKFYYKSSTRMNCLKFKGITLIRALSRSL